MKKDFTPKSRNENLVIQELDGEVLIYDLKKDKAFCLNETSALVWKACDGNNTVAEISEAVGKKLNAPANEDLVWLALDKLSKENLVEKQTEINHKFDGMSRREVMKKVGLGTMVALPIISGLIAPTAVMAQSAVACTCPNGQAPNATSCINSPQCMTGQTCSGVACNSGGNNCGTLNGTCV